MPSGARLLRRPLGVDPVHVAALKPADVDRLLSGQRMIRNRGNIEALVFNAREVLALDRQHGGFDHTFASLGAQQRERVL